MTIVAETYAWPAVMYYGDRSKILFKPLFQKIQNFCMLLFTCAKQNPDPGEVVLPHNETDSELDAKPDTEAGPTEVTGSKIDSKRDAEAIAAAAVAEFNITAAVRSNFLMNDDRTKSLHVRVL